MSIVHQPDIHRKDIVRVLNCAPSKVRDESLDPIYRTHPRDDEFPERVDLRRAWWKIGDQRETGSCVGWAVADSALRWHFVEAGKLQQEKHLSVRFLWMAAKETDNDTREPTTFLDRAETKIQAALDIVKIFGIVDEDTLPFFPTEMYGEDVAKFYENASKFKIVDYKSLMVPKQRGRMNSNIFCKWLAEDKKYGGGPVIVRMGTDTAFVEANKNNPVIEKYDYWSAADRGNHCAAIVGYYREGAQTFFILRNSWGKEWGDDGYAYLSNEYLEEAVQEAWYVKI